MSRRKRWFWGTFGSAALLIVLVAFPYGPLFPWSPVHPGYQVEHFTRADVLYPAGIELPEAYRHVDEYIAMSEKFHRMPVKSRITVVMCSKWGDVQRFTMHPKARMLGGATMLWGTAIYITPKLSEKNLDTGEFLRHELSHSTLNQHESILSAFRMSRQEWFSEGLAVSFGEQKAFITPEEFVASAHQKDFVVIIDPTQRGSAQQPFNMRAAYQTWRYFLEYLVETRGRDTFQQYMTSYMASPGEYRELFGKTYGASLTESIHRFQDDVRENHWRPDPQFAAKLEK